MTAAYRPSNVISPNLERLVSTLKDARSAYHDAKKILEYTNRLNRLKGLLGEYTRPGALLDLGIDGLKYTIGKCGGTLGGAFLQYHEQHFEALKNACVTSQLASVATSNFDRAARLTQDFKRKSESVLKEYKSEGSCYKNMTSAMDECLIAIWLGRGTLEQAIKEPGTAAFALRDLLSLYNRVSHRRKSVELHLDELFSHLIALHQQRSGVSKLTRASNEALAAMPSAHSGPGGAIGDIGRLQAKGSRAVVGQERQLNWESLPSEITYEIGQVEATLKIWTTKLDHYEQTIHDLNLFGPLAGLADR